MQSIGVSLNVSGADDTEVENVFQALVMLNRYLNMIRKE